MITMKWKIVLYRKVLYRDSINPLVRIITQWTNTKRLKIRAFL